MFMFFQNVNKVVRNIHNVKLSHESDESFLNAKINGFTRESHDKLEAQVGQISLT